MNERIQELAEHCDFYVGNEHWDKSHEEQERLFLKKFAELIVRECATLIPAEQSHAPNGQLLLKIFEEHFGVGE